MDNQAAPTPATGRQPGPLFSPRQIAVAAFLGTPLAAGWLIARNLSVLGDQRASRHARVFALLGTVVLLAVAFVLPARIPAPVLPMAYTMGIREFAKRRFGAAVESHVAAGGELQSNWRVFGIGLAGFVVVVVFCVAAAALTPSE